MIQRINSKILIFYWWALIKTVPVEQNPLLFVTGTFLFPIDFTINLLAWCEKEFRSKKSSLPLSIWTPDNRNRFSLALQPYSHNLDTETFSAVIAHRNIHKLFVCLYCVTFVQVSINKTYVVAASIQSNIESFFLYHTLL